MAAYSLTALVAFVVIARKAKFRRLRWDWRFFLVILRKSAPFALLVLLMASYNRIDPILLRYLAGDGAAGVYAGAFRLLDALTAIAYLVSVPLLPVFSKIVGDRHELQDVVRLVFWPMMVFSVGVAVVCAVGAEPLMTLLYPERGAMYIPVFRVVIFGIVPIGLTYIFGTLLTAAGRLRQLNLFAAASLVFNVVVNLLLIPRLGAVGSAWASLTAQSFMALAQFILAVRLCHLPLATFRLPRPADFRHLLALLKES